MCVCKRLLDLGCKGVLSRVSKKQVRVSGHGWRVAGGGMQKGQHVCLFHVLVRSNFSSFYI